MLTHDGVEIRPIPGELGFFARADGTLWTIWNNRVAGRSWVDWEQGDELVRVEESTIGKYRAARMYSANPLRVHVAVLRAFRGLCPAGLEACHNDSDSMNCAITNLRWDTHLSNMKDAIAAGHMYTTGKGRPHKLTPEEELELYNYYATNKFSMRSLAEYYNLSLGGVRLIIIRCKALIEASQL